MDRNDVDWKGYWASCPTPFRAGDEALDLDALRRLLEFYVSCGLHGVLINGTVGEWFSQTEQDRKAVAETAIEAVAGRMTVVIGCTAYTAREVAGYGRHAVQAGADGIEVSAPPYSKPFPDELVRYYQDVCEAVDGPLMVYNWPHGTNLEIGPDHSAGFQLAPAGEHDIVAHANGLEVHFDPASAQRAKGIVIDWVSTVQGEGLSLKFPGAQEIKSLSVQELKARLAAGNITLIDVRPAQGRAQAAPLAQARVLEDEGYESLAALPKDTPLAFICHHGVSSRGMAERFAAHGFTDVYNVEGGMDAWSSEVDSSVPQY